MTKGIVEAVLFVRYTISHFRPIYGRFGSTGGYTKDHLQVTPDVVKLFGTPDDSPVDFAYVWPGGQNLSGVLKPASPGGRTDWEMRWGHNDAPRPWKIGSVGSSPEISIPGNPSRTNPTDADTEFSTIQSSVINPWLIAVKLAGETNRLHIRVYFETPPAGLDDRSVEGLPKFLKDAIAALPAGRASGVVQPPDVTKPSHPNRVPALLKEICEALDKNCNVLLVGPPGTGKTVALEDLSNLHYDKQMECWFFDPSDWGNGWAFEGSRYIGLTDSRFESLVFHPSYGYENFVAGLYPKSDGAGGISLEGKPGPLLRLSHWVGKGQRKALLVMDEFNRGPAAAIFGDTLSLLDASKRTTPSQAGSSISCPYGEFKPQVGAGYVRQPGNSAETLDDQITLPKNLHLVAAMNSSDRSVAPLDAALRRRFSIIRVSPDLGVLASAYSVTFESNWTLPVSPEPTKWTKDEVSKLAIRLLEELNLRIGSCLGEDFLLGHSFLLGLKSEDPVKRLQEMSIAIDTTILQTLKMTFVDQDDVLGAVLGLKPDSSSLLGIAYWKNPPIGMEEFGTKRLEINRISGWNPGEQLLAIRTLIDGLSS